MATSDLSRQSPPCAGASTGRPTGAGSVPHARYPENVFERFTDRARRVLVLAQEEARLLSHSFIGTEHILLGLIDEGEGVAAQALQTLGLSLEAVRERVEETIGMAGTAPSGSPPFTPRAKKVLELALREALQFNHSYIGTEHILLGLVREGEGVAATVLVSLGADLGSVRRATISLMAGNDPLGPDYDVDVGSGPCATTHEWAPPIWDRPSEGTIPAVLVVDAPVLQNDVVALAVEQLEVYINGFTVSLLMRVNPRKVGELVERLGPGGPNRWPQVGVRFADGTIARQGPGVGRLPLVVKDEEGLPTEPIVCMRGGGSGGGSWRAWAWVCPLPPDGPFELLVGFEAAGLAESTVMVDGSSVRAAAERARIVWG